ncbi:hypothetical protein ACJX0J_030539, partial [Zea mays]
RLFLYVNNGGSLMYAVAVGKRNVSWDIDYTGIYAVDRIYVLPPDLEYFTEGNIVMVNVWG